MNANFKFWLAALAIENTKGMEEIERMWKQYCRDCSNFDQSPVTSEFCQWNKLKEPYVLA